ncbi:MAG: clostripain-related cysteine peptidase, partial [Chloroflexota bacterium]
MAFHEVSIDEDIDIPAIEYRALEAFYDSTDGDHWTRNDHWFPDDGTSPCDWYGVTCGTIGGTQKHVVQLRLPENNLSGTIPREIGYLRHLINLRLPSNQLTGAIPNVINNLSRLTDLNLSHNQLTGNIPICLGRLSELTELHLNHNQLRGSVPKELGNLKKLDTLLLNDNELSGALPQLLTKLESLKQFYFNNTELCEPVNDSFQTWLDDTFRENNRTRLQSTNRLCASPIQLEKTVSSELVEPNDEVTYQIIITASEPVETAYLTDTLPISVTYVLNSLPILSGTNYIDGQIQYQGPLKRGRTELSYRATIDEGIAGGSMLTSAAMLKGVIPPDKRGLYLEASATVTLSNTKSAKGKTLVLIYAVGDNNLSSSINSLLNRAETQAHNPNIIVRLMIDRYGRGLDDTKGGTNSYVYELQPDTDLICPNDMDDTCTNDQGEPLYVLNRTMWKSTEDSASDINLGHFVRSSMQAHPDAKQVMLSIVGHGNGWSPNVLPPSPVAWDDSGGKRLRMLSPRGVQSNVDETLAGMIWDDNPRNSLSTKLLGDALRNALSKVPNDKIDLLFLDACSMAMVEVAYEVQDSVNYLLASENTVWSVFPYDQYLETIDAHKNPQDIAEAWLKIYAHELRKKEHHPFTISLIDTQRLDNQLIGGFN